MLTKTDKTFSTGEFAKLLGVKKDTLLYYDKIDLFKPAGILPNGYRYYTLQQIEQFMALQSLRTVNVPIKRLKSYFDAPTPSALQQLAQEQYEHVTQEIKKLQHIQQFLAQTVQLTEEMKHAQVGKVTIETLPAEPIVCSTQPIDWQKSDEDIMEQSNIFFNTLALPSIVAGGDMYPKDVFLQPDFLNAGMGGVSYFFCRTDAPQASLKPAGDYAVLYHEGSYESLATAHNQLREFLAAQQLEIDGPVYDEYLLHAIATKSEQHYMTKISVKVKKGSV